MTLKHFGTALMSVALISLNACSTPSIPTGTDSSLPETLKPLSVPGSGWVQTFSDDFNGTSLDTTKWSASRARSNANNWTSTCWGNVLPENTTVSGGSLHLKLDRHAPITCANPPGDFASGSSQTFNSSTGEVTTLGKFAQQYGYFEARVRFTGIRGLQSAFWLLPPDDVAGGLYGPEVDIQESDQASNSNPTSSWFNYFSAKTNRASGGPGPLINQNITSFGDNGYHTFGLLWSPSSMQLYIDDVYQATFTQDISIFKKPMYLLLQTVLHESLFNLNDTNAPVPRLYDVDWVRVWQRADLVGHWNFSEGSGTTSLDGSGRGNRASLVNTGWTNWGLTGDGTTGSSDGNPDYAPTFNGTSSYVNLGNGTSLNFGGSITVSAWAYVDPQSAGEKVLVGKAWDGSSTPFWLSLLNDHTVRFGHYGPALIVADGDNGTPLTNGWHHFVGSYDGSAYRVYIDGQQKAGIASGEGITTSSSAVSLGRINENGGGKYFKGVIDEVSVHNRALSAQEVLDAYNARR